MALRNIYTSLLFSICFLLQNCQYNCPEVVPDQTKVTDTTTVITDTSEVKPDPIVLKLKPGPEEGNDMMLYSVLPKENRNDSRLHVLAGTWSSKPGSIRSLIKFNYTSIPSGATIKSAKLTLFADTTNIGITSFPNGHSTYGGPNSFFIRKISSPWDEVNTTWETHPTVLTEGEILIQESSKSRDQSYTIDITHFVEQDYLNPSQNHGMMLQLQYEQSYRCVNFCSSDHKYQQLHPEVEIIYTK